MPTRRPRSASDLEEGRADEAAQPPAGDRSRDRRGERGLATAGCRERRETESHGISAFGDLKYPADFHHFDYVNPDAPKGGLFSTIPSVKLYNQSYLTFNSLNAFILKGEGAVGMDLTFTALMSRAGDEPDALYGLLREVRADIGRQADLSFYAAPRGDDFTTAAESPRTMSHSR